MPLDASGNYTPPSVSGYYPPDLFNLGAPEAKTGQRTLKGLYSVRVVDKLPEGDIIQWKVIVEDARGGLNLTQGHFDDDYDRVSSSDLDTRHYRTLILNQLTTNQSGSVTPTANFYGVHSAMFSSKLHIGVGSTANRALFAETSTSDPTLAVVTYSPASAITHMGTISTGSAMANARLAIGHESNVVQLLDAAYATTAMHADTAGCYGIIQTFINNNQLLIYSGGSIRYLDSSVAVTTQPTVGISNVPSGGYALGIAQLSGTPARAYWVWPRVNNTLPLLLGSESPGRLISTNLEGTDFQEIPLGLANVYWACLVGGSAVVASDRSRIVYYDGRSRPRDINWISNREANGNFVYECRGLGQNGQEIIIDVNRYASPNGGNQAVTRWLEAYNLETNAVHQISKAQTIAAAAALNTSKRSVAMARIPISEQTGFSQILRNESGTSTTSWDRMFIPVYGYNPFNLYRQTDSANANTGNEYEATGTYTTPEFELPGLEGWPKMVSRIVMMGNVDTGGTASTAATQTVTAGNLTATFSTGLSGRAQLQELVDAGDVIYKLQLSTTLARTTANTRYTPQGFPIMIEGYAFIGNMEPPFGFNSDGR